MAYDIYMCDLEYSDIIKLPIVPEKFPEIDVGFNNEEFESYNNGYYNLLGNKKLATFTLESFFPEHSGKYPFERSKYIWEDFIILITANYKKPFKIVLSANNITFMNANFIIENFKFYIDKTRDYQYAIDFKEYREATNV